MVAGEGLSTSAENSSICDIYVHVDVSADDQSDFGAATLTDTMGLPRAIPRRKNHLANKDWFYIQLVKRGVNVVQSNSSTISHPGAGCLFSASDPYDLRCSSKFQSLYIEIPRDSFVARFRAQARPAPNTTLSTGSEMGRI